MGNTHVAEEPFGDGPLQDFLATQTKEYGIWIIGWTIPISSLEPHKVYSSNLVYNSQGQLQYQQVSLIRTRTIENLCHFVAVAKTGTHSLI